MVRIALTALLASVACATPPDVKEKAAFARWMVTTNTWGFIATTSTREEASTIGDAFGNPQSIAEIGGVPYFYVSELDASMIDVFVASEGSTRVSMVLSEAQLKGEDMVAACEAGTGLADPENPPCARLQITGNFAKIDNTTDEHDSAMAALLDKHPMFAYLPEDHGFFVAKLDIESMWMVNEFGGAAIISAEEYLAADQSNFLFEKRMKPVGAVDPRPDTNDKVGTARWMAHTLTWGAISSTSTRSEGTVVGAPFANVNSFADGANGELYFYVSDLDATIIDSGASTRVTFAMTEAELEGTVDEVPACTIGAGLADPENPPCARVVFSGDFARLNNTTDEHDTAKAALFDKHPSFQYLPEDHGFFVGKMNLDGIWLVNMFGGAANIAPADYYAYTAAITV